MREVVSELEADLGTDRGASPERSFSMRFFWDFFIGPMDR